MHWKQYLFPVENIWTYFYILKNQQNIVGPECNEACLIGLGVAKFVKYYIIKDCTPNLGCIY